LPHLLDVPQFTDETEEVLRALAIARGGRLPLVDVDSYIGAWHAYLTAVALRLLGYDVAVARGLVLAFGALTVALTYWLAREWWPGRGAALLAAALLAASGAHAVVASRVAWSN